MGGVCVNCNVLGFIEGGGGGCDSSIPRTTRGFSLSYPIYS